MLHWIKKYNVLEVFNNVQLFSFLFQILADVRTLAKVRSLRYVFNLTPFFPLINHPVGLHIFQKPLTTVQVGPGRPSYPPVGLPVPIFKNCSLQYK